MQPGEMAERAAANASQQQSAAGEKVKRGKKKKNLKVGVGWCEHARREPGLCSHRELLGGRRTGKASLGGSEGQRTPAQRQGDAHGRAAGAGGPCGCHAAAGPVQAEFARQLRPAGSEAQTSVDFAGKLGLRQREGPLGVRRKQVARDLQPGR